MDARQDLRFIACPNSGANDCAQPFVRSPRISPARLIAASQKLCLATLAYRIVAGKHTICAAEPVALYKSASHLCAAAIASCFGPGARSSSAVHWGCRKSPPRYSASPSEIALLHDDRTHAGAAMRGASSPWSPQMPDAMTGLPPRFLRTPEAARYLGLSGRTLEKHRTYGTGPTYRKIGGRVVYALDDLKAWADLGAKTSTSDPGKGTVLPAKKQPVLRPYAGQERR